MGPISAALHAHVMDYSAKTSFMYRETPDVVAKAKERASDAWWDHVALAFKGATTTGFAVSSSGLQALWRTRFPNRSRAEVVPVATRDMVGLPAARHLRMLHAVFDKLAIPGFRDHGMRYWTPEPVILILLPRCDGLGVTFFEDAFRASDDWVRDADVMARRRGIDRVKSRESLVEAATAFLANGGDAEDLRAAVDEALVRRVISS